MNADLIAFVKRNCHNTPAVFLKSHILDSF